ncbi:hypothetical protein JFY74_17475 [Pectobacterium carotovorum]|nr:hypothetical protein JFY74_17475 [Pectobacterium carotovorum]
MTNKLIKVQRSDGDSRSFSLDTEDMLKETRASLTNPPHSFMDDQDAFIFKNSEIDRSAEILIKLESLLGDSDILNIGTAGDIGGDDGVQRYNRMSKADKLALFKNIQIYRGLTVDQKGFSKTFKNLYQLADTYMPEANDPYVLTELQQSYTFTEVTHTMERSGVQSGSISLTTPWGGGETNYKYAQEHSESSSQTNTFMTQRFLSRKIDLSIDDKKLIADKNFVLAVQQAVKGHERSIDGYANLVNVLNEFGWYIPIKYTLGGVLYATKTTAVSKRSEADSDSSEFGASFKMAFDGIGGGAAYNNASGHKSSSGSSHSSEDVTILQIGGHAGTQNDFEKWNDSLNEAITWNVAAYTSMLPSLILLVGIDNQTLSNCHSLLAKYNTYATVLTLQPYISVSDYERDLANRLNPFA